MDRLLIDGGFFTILAFASFRIFSFLDDFLCPPLVLEIWLLGGMI